MKIWQKFIRLLIRFYVTINFLVIKLIPLNMAVFIGGRIGLIVYCLFGKERKKSIQNLRESFPDKTEDETHEIAREVFVNFGKSFMEILCYQRFDRKRINDYVSIEGEEFLREGLDKGEGVVILMAHFGSWELLGARLALNEYPLNVIARRIYDPILNSKLVNIRSSWGENVILRGESPRDILNVFKNNQMLCILLDQYSARFQGVFVEFFKRKCYTSKGLASIVSKKDVSVIPCFIVRNKKGHTLHVEKPVEPVRLGDKEEEVRRNTQLFTGIIEKWVREYPSHWVWMHDRWKIPPNQKNTVI